MLGDLGEDGIKLFQKSHSCNGICRSLGLDNLKNDALDEDRPSYSVSSLAHPFDEAAEQLRSEAFEDGLDVRAAEARVKEGLPRQKVDEAMDTN